MHPRSSIHPTYEKVGVLRNPSRMQHALPRVIVELTTPGGYPLLRHTGGGAGGRGGAGSLENLGEDGVEVELFDEGPAASYPDLLDDVGEMILYGVLGDVEGLTAVFVKVEPAR
jgi:hypothetical protein